MKITLSIFELDIIKSLARPLSKEITKSIKNCAIETKEGLNVTYEFNEKFVIEIIDKLEGFGISTAGCIASAYGSFTNLMAFLDLKFAVEKQRIKETVEKDKEETDNG